MNKTTRSLLTAAALAGLYAGSFAARAAAATTPARHAGQSVLSNSNSDSDNAKHACKGQNSCKGQGGCSSGDNGCKGKNSCKGKGGCGSMDQPKG